jgi:hypothetical protein
VAAEASASVVVDASKGPAQALALSRSPGIDLRLLHLVRDVRGVAFSWAKAGVARPQAAGGDGVMASYRAHRTATHWSAFQAEAAVIRAAVEHSARLRYEDLVAAPRRSLSAALAGLGLPEAARSLDHVHDGGVTLPVSHGLAGNPGRFKSGFQALRLDEEWRSAMSPGDRWSVTALGMPSLASYGYLVPRSAGEQR